MWVSTDCLIIEKTKGRDLEGQIALIFQIQNLDLVGEDVMKFVHIHVM